MSETTIFNTITDVSGNPLKGVTVSAALIRPAFYGETGIVDTHSVKSDANGYWELQLVPNTQISPLGTYYKISEGARTKWSVIVPSSVSSIHLSNIVLDEEVSDLPWPVLGDKGPTGDKGLRGDQGLIGLTGPQGIVGNKGVTGDQGIQGIQGNQGTQGDKGITGDKGSTGDQGLRGDQGTQGSAGPQGNQGPTGQTGLQGPLGNKGADGNQGIQGIQGDQGIKGVIGDKGLTGDKGASGDAGSQGIQGIQGIQGNKGDKGDKGDPFSFKGIVANSGALPGSGNTNGDSYLVQSTNTLWTWQTSAWVDTLANIVGPTGPTGAAGAQGIQGIQGAAGTNGTVISIAQNTVPFRTTTGTGAPDTSITVAVAPTNDAIARRNSGGELRVATATLTDSAIPLAQFQAVIDDLQAQITALNNQINPPSNPGFGGTGGFGGGGFGG